MTLIDRAERGESNDVSFNLNDGIFLTEKTFFLTALCNFAGMMELGKKNSCSDGIGIRTEREKIGSSSSCKG